MIAHCKKGEVTEKKDNAIAEGHVTCQYRIEGIAGVTTRVSPLCSGKYTVNTLRDISLVGAGEVG